MFENRMLRRIFCPKRAEETGRWRKLLNEELRDLCSLSIIIRMVKFRRMKWAGNVTRMVDKINWFMLLVGKTRGNETTRKTRR
jgi:hypothetical protein